MKKIFIFTICLFAACSQAASFFDQLHELGVDKYWLKLLHYKKKESGNYEGLVDSPDFYFHPQGKKDPEKELEATINAFNNPSFKVDLGQIQASPQCVFVERYAFLQKHGMLKSRSHHIFESEKICQDFYEWKQGIEAKSVHLVFSSSYPNNPASLFGHTFIRFGKNKGNDLLDYSASFAAHTEGDAQGPKYAFKGIFGGYKGYFMFSPYYMKVNEYSNSESRDLYEYELNIDQKGIDRIINHLWELYLVGYFDYYFLDENCSYILALVLELGNLDWNLSEIKRWYYLPSDSIKLLNSIPGAIKNVIFRPSLKKGLIGRAEKLNKAEKQSLNDLIKGRVEVAQQSSIKVLDALISYLDYRKHEKKGKLDLSNKTLFRRALLKRAKLGKKSVGLEARNDTTYRPENGHDPSKVVMGLGNKNGNSVWKLHIKSGLHDLLANDAGLEPFSQIDFLGFGLEYNAKKRTLDLSQIEVVNATSIHPFTFFDSGISWEVGLNYDQIYYSSCEECHRFDMNGGAGLSFNVGGAQSKIFGMVGGFAELSKHLNKSYSSGGYVSWSFLSNPFSAYKMRIGQIYRNNFFDSLSTGFYLKSFFSHSFSWKKNWEIRLKSQYLSRYGDFTKNLYVYDFQVGYYF